MKVYDILLKKADQKTPLILKIAIIISVWFLASGLVKILMGLSWQSGPSIIFTVAQVLSLVAIWNLRKWAVYALVILSIVGIAYAYLIAGYSVSAMVLSALIIVRLIPLVPAIFYWKKFTA
jgi:hypothetical protein